MQRNGSLWLMIVEIPDQNWVTPFGDSGKNVWYSKKCSSHEPKIKREKKKTEVHNLH